MYILIYIATEGAFSVYLDHISPAVSQAGKLLASQFRLASKHVAAAGRGLVDEIKQGAERGGFKMSPIG